MKIANQAVDKDSKPFVDIRIANCGELIPQIKSKGNFCFILFVNALMILNF